MKHGGAVFLIAASACVLAIAASGSSKSAKHKEAPETPEAPAEPEGGNGGEGYVSPPLKHGDVGIETDGSEVTVVDWSAWMKTAPALLETVLSETNDPEEIAANLFRRIYPDRAWPPSDPDGLEQWTDVVAAIARSLERSWKTHLRVV